MKSGKMVQRKLFAGQKEADVENGHADLGLGGWG